MACTMNGCGMCGRCTEAWEVEDEDEFCDGCGFDVRDCQCDDEETEDAPPEQLTQAERNAAHQREQEQVPVRKIGRLDGAAVAGEGAR